MIQNKRNLVLDVFDINGNKVCPLYDNTSNVSGQAVNVFVITERNGWKELSFTIPSTCKTSDGNEDNFRLDYIIGDYRIRSIDDDGVDWFLISEPKVTHNSFSKDVHVTAGHISQLLKTKNLGLEFSDKAGNNVGTAKELATTILDGTGWTVGNVDTFYEKDGVTEKKRTLKASAKTGAYKQMSTMCELFDAKPIYNGDSKTVDIVPINPFSKPVDGSLPDLTKADGVVELHYGSNVKNVTRTINTENLITKLYVYGAYGDDVSGYCGIDEIEHSIVWLTLTQNVTKGTPVYFTVTDETGTDISYSFVPTANLTSGNKLKLSFYDKASELYIWHVNTELAYRLTKGKSGDQLHATQQYAKEQNNFSFIMDFSYYDKNGLISDDAIQAIADYQQKGLHLKANVLEKTNEANETLQVLSETIGSVDFCKLNVTEVGTNGTEATITLRGNEDDDLGVLYRTDYDALKKDRFTWRVSTGVKPTGESINSEASVLYVVHHTTPVTWEKLYIKQITNNPNNIVLDLWFYDYSQLSEGDSYYLFSSNNVNGYLGAYETADESAVTTLKNAVKVVTTEHPVYFSTTSPLISDEDLNGYGWWCKYYLDKTLPEQFFCYTSAGDKQWYRVYCQDREPAKTNKAYWFDWKRAIVSRCIDGEWKQLVTKDTETSEIDGDQYSVNTRAAEAFSSVYRYMLTRDKYYKGQYQNLKVEIASTKASGNYYIKDEYNSFYLFSTTEDLNPGDTLVYDTTKGHVVQTANGQQSTLEMKTYRFDSVKYHSGNILESAVFSTGAIDEATGGEIVNDEQIRTGFISVYPGTQYVCTKFPSGTKIFFYTKKNNYLSCIDVSNKTVLSTVDNAGYIRIASSADADSFNGLRLYSPLFESAVVVEDKTYEFVGDVVGEGELKGIAPQIEKFVNCADMAYEEKLVLVKSSQEEFTRLEHEVVNRLGDIYREGYWQSKDYIDGDEQKLYDDAVENLTELAQPEISYSIGFVDKYGVEEQSNVEAINDVMWPDLSIRSAAHLVDPSISVNCWAYIDKVSKCYDVPEKTSIVINTKMSTIGQHSFTDVLANIADVASELKGKENLYSRAGSITSTGAFAAERLEGKIDANKQLITGGSSTWYTDDKGNQVFESADGTSAMTLTGNGFAIANSKDVWGNWNWRTFGTGEGFTADMLIAGYISAERIEAGSIESGKLSTAVQHELGKITGINNWVEEAKIELSPQKITQIVLKSAEFKDSITHTYFQEEEPQGTFNVGDRWIQPTVPRLLWDDLDGTIWEEMKGLSWVAIVTKTNPITYIWDGTTWVSVADFSFVADMMTTVDQTAESITHLATKETVNALTGQVTSMETRVTQTAEAIKQMATKGELTSAIEQTASSLSSQITNVETGLQTKITQNERSIGAKVDQNGIIAAINLSAEEALIQAPKIKFEGLVTANNYFMVKEDGSIEAKNAIISGNITALSGSIGGWQIDEDSIYSGSGANTVKLSTGSAYAIWAGAESASSAPFRVTKTGELTATDADITGKITSSSGSIGGWTIKEGYLHSGTGSNGVYLSTTDATYRVWAGADLPDKAPFKVSKSGALVAANAKITGEVTADSGTIGGWSIGENLLYSGSGNNRVALSTGDSTYAIWAGAETPNNASFRVTKDGKVYLTRVMALANEGDTTPTEVNLSNISFWRLNRTVKTLSVDDNVLTIELYNGTSVNFKKASSVEYMHTTQAGGGTGTATLTVKALTELAEELASTSIRLECDTANKRVTFSAPDSAMNGYIECSGIYTNGVNSVTLTDVGWVNGTNKINASNGKSVTVNLPSFSVSGGDSFTNNKTTVYFYTPILQGAYLASKEINATGIYNNGRTVGANSLVFYAGGYESVANLNYGESVSITATTTKGDGTSVAKGILVKAPADNYNTGWNECVDAMEAVSVIAYSPSYRTLYERDGSGNYHQFSGTLYYQSGYSTYYKKPNKK